MNENHDQTNHDFYIDIDRLLFCVGHGLSHGLLGIMAGGFITTAVGVGVEALGLLPESINLYNAIEIGGIVGGLIGLYSGFADAWETT